MAPVVAQNLIIDKGTTFEATFYFTNDDGSVLDLNNNNITARLRKHFFAVEYYTFTCSATISEGSITLIMDSEVTETLPYGRCVYDIIIENNQGKKRKLIEGNVIVKGSVSQ